MQPESTRLGELSFRLDSFRFPSYRFGMVKTNIITRLEPQERDRVRQFAERMSKRLGVPVSESAAIRALVLAGLEAKRER